MKKWRAFTFTDNAKIQRAELQRRKNGAKLWAGEGKKERHFEPSGERVVRRRGREGGGERRRVEGGERGSRVSGGKGVLGHQE